MSNEAMRKGIGALAGVAMFASLTIAAPIALADDNDASATTADQTTQSQQSADGSVTTADQTADAGAATDTQDSDSTSAPADDSATASDTTQSDAAATPAETAPAAATVATVDGTAYATLKEAVEAAHEGSTVTLTANSAETVTITKTLSFTAEQGVTFTGTLTFAKGADGSSIEGFTFELPVEGFDAVKGETRNSVKINGASGITVSGNTFNYPSALFKGAEWQRNGVWVQNASDVTIENNQFNLGRLNDTNGSGDVAADSNSNSAVNLVGGGNGAVHDIIIRGNTLTVTAPAADATRDASVNLLIANGNNTNGGYGIKNVTVTGNAYDGAADPNNGSTRFAGISNVSGATFTDNTIRNAQRGIGQSVWGSSTNSNVNVTVRDNVFENVKSENEFANETTVATVTVNNVSTQYDSLAEAVAAANATSNATVTLYQSVTDHASVEFKTKVAVVAANSGITFNGTMRLSGSDSVVQGMHFVYDTDFPAGNKANLKVSSNTSNVRVVGNTFEVQHGVTGQPNSVWIEGAAKATVVDGNTFNLDGGNDISVVGVALTAWSSTVMDGTQITNNKVTMVGKDVAGFNLFVKAYGAHETLKASFGITNLTVSGNTFDSEQPAGVGNFLGASNVNGLTVANNSVSNTTNGVFNVNYQNKTEANAGVVVSGNTFKDVINTVNPTVVNLKSADGTVTPGLTYLDNMVKAQFTNIAPYRESTGYKAPAVPNGMVFVGWFTDDALTQTLGKDVTSGQAYAKFVRQTDAVEFDFQGGSLRIDASNGADYSKTSLRFGYRTKLVDPNLTLREVAWAYNINGKEHTTTANNPYVDDEGYTVNNLVFTGVPVASYNTTIYTRNNLTYVTADGTSVKVAESATQSRSVAQVARAIVADVSAGEVIKAYAQGVLDALDAQAQ